MGQSGRKRARNPRNRRIVLSLTCSEVEAIARVADVGDRPAAIVAREAIFGMPGAPNESLGDLEVLYRREVERLGGEEAGR